MLDPWKRTGTNTMRNGDSLIVRMPWGKYILWRAGRFINRFETAEEAKQHAASITQDTQHNQKPMGD